MNNNKSRTYYGDIPEKRLYYEYPEEPPPMEEGTRLAIEATDRKIAAQIKAATEQEAKSSSEDESSEEEEYEYKRPSKATGPSEVINLLSDDDDEDLEEQSLPDDCQSRAKEASNGKREDTNDKDGEEGNRDNSCL